MKANLHWRKWLGIGLLATSFPLAAQSPDETVTGQATSDLQYELLAGLSDEFIEENKIKPSAEADLYIKASRLRLDLAKEQEVELSARTGWAKDFVWKFGDGKVVSGFQHVKHRYEKAGTYQITLLASSGDKLERQQIELEVVDSRQPEEWQEMEHYIVFPHNNRLEAKVQMNLPKKERKMRFQIQDIEGREVFEYKLGKVRKREIVSIDLRNLPDGKYYAVLKGKKYSLVSRLTVTR